MDVKPIYELRTRMRAAAIAGTNLLAEDFRFKKAAEAIKPLERVSPAFNPRVSNTSPDTLGSADTGGFGTLYVGNGGGRW